MMTHSNKMPEKLKLEKLDGISVHDAIKGTAVELSHGISLYFTSVIFKVFTESGQPISKAEAEMLGNSLIKEAMTYFKGLKCEEIALALSLGIRGKWGDYYGLNIKTFHFFMREYRVCNERARAIEALQPQKKIQLTSKIMTEEDKQKIIIEGVIAQFVEYKKNKNAILYVATYDWLDRHGFINLTKERKRDMYYLAIETLKKQMADEVGYGREYKNYCFNLTQWQHPDAVVEAKKIALKEYFDSLIELDQNISELIFEE